MQQVKDERIWERSRLTPCSGRAAGQLRLSHIEPLSPPPARPTRSRDKEQTAPIYCQRYGSHQDESIGAKA